MSKKPKNVSARGKVAIPNGNLTPEQARQVQTEYELLLTELNSSKASEPVSDLSIVEDGVRKSRASAAVESLGDISEAAGQLNESLGKFTRAMRGNFVDKWMDVAEREIKRLKALELWPTKLWVSKVDYDSCMSRCIVVDDNPNKRSMQWLTTPSGHEVDMGWLEGLVTDEHYMEWTSLYKIYNTHPNNWPKGLPLTVKYSKSARKLATDDTSWKVMNHLEGETIYFDHCERALLHAHRSFPTIKDSTQILQPVDCIVELQPWLEQVGNEMLVKLEKKSDAPPKYRDLGRIEIISIAKTAWTGVQVYLARQGVNLGDWDDDKRLTIVDPAKEQNETDPVLNSTKVRIHEVTQILESMRNSNHKMVKPIPMQSYDYSRSELDFKRVQTLYISNVRALIEYEALIKE